MKWEHKMANRPPFGGSYGEILSKHGEAGWELCGVTEGRDGSTTFYFKRPKEEKDKAYPSTREKEKT